MGPHLTYRPREGVVVGVVAGKSFRLTTLRNQAGAPTLWDHAFESPDRHFVGALGPRRTAAAPRVVPWEKVQEIRSGASAGAVGHKLTVAENAALEIYDWPGEYAQRFDGVKPGGAAGRSPNHRHPGSAVFVKQPGGGFHLHGPPSCGNPRCIIIVQDWDSLFRALKATRQVSIVVEL